LEENAIKLIGVSKSFKLQRWNAKNSSLGPEIIRPVDNVSLTIKKQKMIGIIGKNGSGKTTLLRLISNIYSPDKGTIEINGKIGPLLQIGVGTNDEYSVSENIILNGLLLGFKKKWIENKVSAILKFAELEEYQNVKMKYLSTGMKVRIMFSTGMLIDPDILLVDEVISVGDATFNQKSLDAFLSFKKRGKTIILVSHNLPQIQELCDEVYMLDKGKIVKSGNPEEVIKYYIDFCNPT